MREKLVIVGNGMAGMRTVEDLLAIAPEKFDITVFGAEPHGNYNRILLSSVLAGEKNVDEIMIHDTTWYQDNGITLITGNPVTTIDRERRQVTAADDTTVFYDKLLLATGSDPILLPLPGRDLAGVLTFRNLADVDQLMAASRKKGPVAVIGGGLLGLEAAVGLAKQGMDVTVVHLMESLMERQLDAAAADLLQRELQHRGITFRLATATSAILGENGAVTGLAFQDGSQLRADLVVMGVGIRPNSLLAEAAGLICDRGVVVDDGLRTSDPRIFAVGECVRHQGVAYGLVAPLYEQAKVCATHIAEIPEPATYTGSDVYTRLKVTGADLFSAGTITGDDQTETVLFQDPSRKIYKKLLLQNGTIRGAVLVGDTRDGPWYFDLIRDKRDIQEIRDQLIFGQAYIMASGKTPPPAWAGVWASATP